MDSEIGAQVVLLGLFEGESIFEQQPENHQNLDKKCLSEVFMGHCMMI